MTQNKFTTSLIWEIKNLFRFPFPEVLLATFTYMIFLSEGIQNSFTLPFENLTWNSVTSMVAYNSAFGVALLSPSAYIPMGIFASVFATLTFAYEIENGIMKAHLSHAISKRTLFLTKLSSVFLIIFITFSLALLSRVFLNAPENSLYLILSPSLIFKVLLTATLQSLFFVSISTSFSLYSGKTSVSLIGSFAIIYLLQFLSQSTGLEYLPPTAFTKQISYLFWRPLQNPAELAIILALPLTSVFLIILSYLYFSRRLEIS